MLDCQMVPSFILRFIEGAAKRQNRYLPQSMIKKNFIEGENTNLTGQTIVYGLIEYYAVGYTRLKYSDLF